jgi:hypothetical protein
MAIDLNTDGNTVKPRGAALRGFQLLVFKFLLLLFSFPAHTRRMVSNCVYN